MTAAPIPVGTIDETGFHAPSFETKLEAFVTIMKEIYGSDIVLTSDTQDGELVSIITRALYDTDQMARAVYASRNPKDARGVGLSGLVKINGITRQVPSYSTADLVLEGQQGTVIVGAQAQDENGFIWLIPSTVIPAEGQITVTAQCTELGSISAPAGTINHIQTATVGWQKVYNPADAIPGAPVETDAALRLRQSRASGLPASAAVHGIASAIANTPGVVRWRVYENIQGYPDDNGIPGHTIALVVDGGTVDAISEILYLKRGQGIGFYGDVLTTRTDEYGIPNQIAFSRSRPVPVAWRVWIRPKSGFTYPIHEAIRTALSQWTNNQAAIGQNVEAGDAYEVVRAVSPTFQIVRIDVARDGAEPNETEAYMAFNEIPTCAASDVNVLVMRHDT